MRYPLNRILVHVLDSAHEQLRGTRRQNSERSSTDGHYDRTLCDRPTSDVFRRALLLCRDLTRAWLVVGTWVYSDLLHFARHPDWHRGKGRYAALRLGLDGYDEYVHRVRWRLIPF